MRLKIVSFFLTGFISLMIACKKDAGTSDNSGFNLNLLKGGTWMEYSRNSPGLTPTMKFHFYNDSNVTYSYLSSIYPTIKYDSVPNAKWRFAKPDTLWFYNQTYTIGHLKLLKLTDTVMHARIQNYGDTTLFKRY